MNENTPKLKKMILILFLIAVAVTALRLVRKANSMTLSEYADQNPDKQQAVQDLSDSPPVVHDAESRNDDLQDAESRNDDLHDANANSASMVPNDVLTETNINMESDMNTNQNTALNTETTYTDFNILSPEEAKAYFNREPLSEEMISYITGISYPAPESLVSAPAVDYEDLSHLNILHYNFDGNVVTGELICNNKIADDLLEIFYELYVNEYQIEKVKLIDEYAGDDNASMADNNTSSFNYRVVEGTTNLSNHAYGLAIDINPFYNPYITYPSGEKIHISPEGSEPYADRSKDFPYKIDESDLCYRLFKSHGFTWGGDWNSCKDYQHFQKK